MVLNNIVLKKISKLIKCRGGVSKQIIWTFFYSDKWMYLGAKVFFDYREITQKVVEQKIGTEYTCVATNVRGSKIQFYTKHCIVPWCLVEHLICKLHFYLS